MPRFKNGRGEYEYVDVIFNSSTMINRENVGQVFELSLNHIGCAIIDKIINDRMNVNDAYDMIRKFVSMCSKEQAEYMDLRKENMSKEELEFFVESIINSGAIHLSLKPISESMSIDKLRDIYKEFPWITQNEIEIALKKSNGEIRYVKARRPIVIGKQYIYRLKQFSEEKFSATSLSSTNIRNENTKSRDRKDFRELYPNTPIRFGNMETNNMAHIGVEALIANMMIHSLSPQGRRLVEQMYTGDPFNIDIKLDHFSTNRSAEIANTYLKTIGRRLKFIKKKKDIKKPIRKVPIYFNKPQYKKPVSFISDERKANFDVEKDFKARQEFKDKVAKSNAKSPIRYLGSRKKI